MYNPYGFQFYHWHIEPSSKCPVRCPRCPRTEMAKEIPWMQKQLSLELFKKAFTEDLLKNEVKRITMCGDVGDPIYCREYIEICDYIKSTNPDIHLYTITNGSYMKESWWRDFGSVLNDKDTVAFSIDGYDNASNNKYRVNSDWDSIITGMTTLTQMKKAYITWATIIFKFNQDHLDTIQKLATDHGCDTLQLTKSIKFGSRFEVYNTDANYDDLEPRTEHISQSGRYERTSIVLSDRVKNNDDYLNHNKMMFEKVRQEYKDEYIIPLCKIGNRGLYLNADGQIYPCSWVAAPYRERRSPITGKHILGPDSMFRKYDHLMDLKSRTLEEIISDPVWEKLFGSFRNKDKAFIECEEKCNNCVVDDVNYSVGYLTN